MIIGVAVLMIVIMWLTGGGKKSGVTPAPITPPPPVAAPTDSNKIQAFKHTIQAEQQRAMQPQRFKSRAAPAAEGTSGTSGSYGSTLPAVSAYPPSADADVGLPQTAEQTQPSAVRVRDPIKAQEKRLDYKSLFASNVALTYRQGRTATELMRSSGRGFESGVVLPPSDAADRMQELRDAEALAAMGPPPPQMPQSQSNFQPASLGAKTQPAAKAPQPQGIPAGTANSYTTQRGEFNYSRGKRYVLFEGTIIPTVLMNRLNGSFAGPVNCLVTHDIYSQDRQHVLIPAGSKVLGEAKQVIGFGQERLAVFFHRLIKASSLKICRHGVVAVCRQ